MKGDIFPVVLLNFRQGEYMPASSSGVGNSPSLTPQSVVAESAAKSPSGAKTVGEGGLSKAASAIWNKLSADLKQNPALHWQNALSTADELARSVCGQDLPEDFQADLIGNLNLLEQTLLGLKIQSTDGLLVPGPHIKELLSVLKLNVVTTSKQLETLHSLKKNSSN